MFGNSICGWLDVKWNKLNAETRKVTFRRKVQSKIADKNSNMRSLYLHCVTFQSRRFDELNACTHIHTHAAVFYATMTIRRYRAHGYIETISTLPVIALTNASWAAVDFILGQRRMDDCDGSRWFVSLRELKPKTARDAHLFVRYRILPLGRVAQPKIWVN